ncbi:hypothetical protein [Pseudomarimonas arenosa]|uniref:hypothetical protein n=1 Tax=Pseudomarimonas arenosa TaxID=2774145 RepID=UPI001CDC9EE0|nr:hypothetical protein [Pseudomarimonas arenosa]
MHPSNLDTHQIADKYIHEIYWNRHTPAGNKRTRIPEGCITTWSTDFRGCPTAATITTGCYLNGQTPAQTKGQSYSVTID